MTTTDRKFTRSDIEAILATGLGTTADDVRVTGSSTRVGAFEEFLMYITAEIDFPDQVLHTLAAYTGANFTELDVTMARSWVAGRVLV